MKAASTKISHSSLTLHLADLIVIALTTLYFFQGTHSLFYNTQKNKKKPPDYISSGNQESTALKY